MEMKHLSITQIKGIGVTYSWLWASERECMVSYGLTTKRKQGGNW